MGRDRAQHLPASASGAERGIRLPALAWWRRRARSTRHAQAIADLLGADPLEVAVALRGLPDLLEGSSVPAGVVELVVEEDHAAERYLLDMHDGRIVLAQPGSAVPWASISGTRAAWALALRNGSSGQLQLTGDKHLAQRLLDVLPRGLVNVRA